MSMSRAVEEAGARELLRSISKRTGLSQTGLLKTAMVYLSNLSDKEMAEAFVAAHQKELG